LHLPFAGSSLGKVSAPWQRQIAPGIERILRAEAGATQMTIASLIGEAVDGAVHRHGRQASVGPIREKIGSE
jgi:hypothetical protein